MQGRRPTVQVPRDSRRGAAAPAHAWRRCRAQFDDLAPTADHLSPGARRLSSSSRPARTCASAPGHGKVPHRKESAPRTHRQGRRARARPQTRAPCAFGCGRRPLESARRQSREQPPERSWPTRMWPLTGFRPPDIVGSRRGSNPRGADHLLPLQQQKRCARRRRSALAPHPHPMHTRSPPRLVCFRRRSTPRHRRHPAHRRRRRRRARRRPRRRRR